MKKKEIRNKANFRATIVLIILGISIVGIIKKFTKG